MPIARDLDVSAGAAYEKTESDDNTRLDNETYTGFLGLRGALTPKLNGSLQAGLQRRELDFGDSSTAPYFSAGLIWTVDRSTSVGLVASRQLRKGKR